MIRTLLLALFLVSAALTGQVPTEATRLHIILAVDSHAQGIGPMTVISARKLDARLRDIIYDPAKPQRAKKFTLSYVGLDDNLLDANQIKTQIAGLSVSPTESIFFYYAGHGAIDPQGNRILQLSGGTMYRSELIRALQAKGARSVVLVTDSCSSYIEPKFMEGVGGGQIPAEWKVFEDLFFRQQGLIDVTASLAGTFAWFDGHIGGYFTSAMADEICAPHPLLDTNGDGLVSWYEFLPNLAHSANRLYRQQRHHFAATAQAPSEMLNQDLQIAYAMTAPTKVNGRLVPNMPNHAVFLETGQTYDVIENGQKGMKMYLHFHTSGYKKRQLAINLYLRNGDGKFIMDRDGLNRAADGTVVFHAHATPNEQDGCIKDEIFVPYSQLHMGHGDGMMYYFAQLTDPQTKTLLASTRQIPFRFSSSPRGISASDYEISEEPSSWATGGIAPAPPAFSTFDSVPAPAVP